MTWATCQQIASDLSLQTANFLDSNIFNTFDEVAYEN